MTKEEIQRSFAAAEANFVPEHKFAALYREHINSAYMTPEEWETAEREGISLYGRKIYPLRMRGHVPRYDRSIWDKPRGGAR